MVGRGNDAIPTWSGFNYQGKAMLLYVLNQINELDIKNGNDDYYVELEKTEDFSIIYKTQYLSFHQVKAWLSKNKWSSYREAMDKLLLHRNTSSNPTASCYLVVARDIKDWDDASNTYISSINLYKYDSNIVGVREVKDLIMGEIEKYLIAKGYPKKSTEIVYGALCLFLDDSIADMHKQNVKKRKHKISFDYFIGIIEDTVKKQTVREEYYLKEQIYDYIMENMERALDRICHDACDDSLENCNKLCAAKKAYEKVLAIPDLSKYCRVLNPSKIDGWDNSLCMVECLPSDRIESEIYDLFFQSSSPEKVQGDNNKVYLISKHSQAPNGQIIPTLLDLSRGYRYGEKTLQEIFKNIIRNTDIIDLLEGSSITALPGSYKGSLTQAQISSGWQQSDPRKINGFSKDIEIISSIELQNKFIAEGGNHD